MERQQKSVSSSVISGLLACLLLTSFAGCGGDSSEPSEVRSTAPNGSTLPPRPAARPDYGVDTTESVLADSLPYAEIGDELVYGYFAIPVDMIDPYPAIVMLHDGFGLDDGARALAERIADEGFIVLAVDLFFGRTADEVSAARELQIEVLEDMQTAESNIAQALEFISSSTGAPSIGVLGFGFGGGLTLDTAIEHSGDVAAAVNFYGQVKTDRDSLRQLTVPVLGFFLENDRAVLPQTVRDFEQVMEGLGQDATIHIYDTGRRGFMDRFSSNYDEALAERSWEEAFAFLNDAFGVAED